MGFEPVGSQLSPGQRGAATAGAEYVGYLRRGRALQSQALHDCLKWEDVTSLVQNTEGQEQGGNDQAS